MRSPFGTLLLLCLAAGIAKAGNDTLSLPLTWKFKPGDDVRWAESSFDDRLWQSIKFGTLWEEQGYPGYDGCAWYRTRIVIPHSMLSRSFHHAGVKIRLGMIDDADSTFVNGVFLGTTRGYNILREYHISPELLRSGKVNTVAVRVYDWGGGGGCYAPPFVIVPLSIDDCARFVQEKDSTILTHSPMRTSMAAFWLHNSTGTPLHGTAVLRAVEVPSDSVLMEQRFRVNLRRKERLLLSSAVPASSARLVHYLLIYRDSTEHVASTPRIFTSHRDESPNPVVSFGGTAVAANAVLEPLVPESFSPAGVIGERFFINLRSRLMANDLFRFLRGFTDRPGEQDWIGEHAGKYLHAASLSWLATRDEALKRQMDQVANILITSQDEDGYLGTYLAQDRWSRWDVWIHKYDLVGLLAYYRATGYRPALECARRAADLLCSTFGDGPGQRDIITTREWCGLASTSVIDPMTDLYRYTGNPAYLAYCESIVRAYTHADGSNLVNGLASKRCVLGPVSQKAYELLSNLRGLLRFDQLADKPDLRSIVVSAWEDVAANHTFITGSASVSEQFRPHGVRPASADDHIAEGCVTTTWMQLSSDLYAATGEPRYADEVERTVYNHLLAAENPFTGDVCMYPPLQGVKKYSPDITCCQSSIGRGIAIIPDQIWQRHAKGGLCLSLYAASSVVDTIPATSGRNVVVRAQLETTFPEDSTALLTVACSDTIAFPLRLRVPLWSTGMRAICGTDQVTGMPGSFLVLDRVWRDTTRVSISLGMNPRVLADPANYPGRIGFAVGPQVLALDLSLNPEARGEVDVTFGDDAVSGLRRVAGVLPMAWKGRQAFAIPGYIKGKPSTITLVPYADAGQTGGEQFVWVRKR
jgi:uncharacterized protein